MTLYTLEKPLGVIEKSYSVATVQYSYDFESPQEGKAYFCNKILKRYEVDTVSSHDLEMMGDFLSQYSSAEKCYIIRAYYTAASDYYRWLHRKDDGSAKTNLEYLGETSGFRRAYELCQKLSYAVQKKIDGTSYTTVLVPDICCEAQDALHKPSVFSCTEPESSYLKAMPLIGCSNREDVCDGGRFNGYSYFEADKPTKAEL
jgi:hypothetical protein